MKIGLGFVTGRNNFKSVLRTYISSFIENGLYGQGMSLDAFIAYDLGYMGTKLSDYRIIDQGDIHRVNNVHYIGKETILNDISSLIKHGVLDFQESQLLFGEGYGKKRNIIMYNAIINKIDYLLFLDDDEYPLVPIKTGDNKLTWRGQDIAGCHLQSIGSADVTNGYHSGYISPIPYIEYNNVISEDDFRVFIEALSNDILNWDSIKCKMADDGVTYGDERLLESGEVAEVEEIHGTKFISGSNLCINLRANPESIPPFYNPPKARGEDTFFSTCLSELKVLRVPCYAFHDGFQNYNCLLNGVLPDRLIRQQALSAPNIQRFLKASIGWARYKPLLTYITHNNDYAYIIKNAKEKMQIEIPRFCEFFHTPEFEMIINEFQHYHDHVEEHFESFERTKQAWKKVAAYARSIDVPHHSIAPDVIPYYKELEKCYHILDRYPLTIEPVKMAKPVLV
ncbi:MAG: hypothetical protein ACM3UZ_07590 [Acidobacteriota bacterium]